MRTLIKLLVSLLLLSLPLLAGLGWFALSDTPLVSEDSPLSHHDIARIRSVLGGEDPRRLAPGTQRTLEISAHDLDLAANYLAHYAGGTKARARLDDQQIVLRASLVIPGLSARRHLNLEAWLHATDGQPKIARLRIGQIPIPPPLAEAALRVSVSLSGRQDHLARALEMVERIEILPDRVRVHYRWHPALIAQAQDTLLGGGNREALRFYHDRLVDLQQRGMGVKGPLMPLLGALFDAASGRSALNDPVTENTALLTVLATWASHQNLRRLVPDSNKQPGRFRLKLQQRYDFAQHFLTSAALAARGDGTLSDAVGLLKEINDTDHGSGFSFTDIAADRAGTRFGQLASGSPAGARWVQRQVAGGIQELDVMPPALDLPEHLDAPMFRQDFGHIGSDAYNALIREIDQRINTARLYANRPSR